MAIFYRAIWADSQPGIVDQANDRFCSWAREKSNDALAAAGGDEKTENGDFVFRLRDVMSEDPDSPVVRVLSGTLVENKPDGSRWTTTLRAWHGPLVRDETHGAESWLWVDVDAVSHDSLDSVVMAAPRFVRSVIEDGADPNRHGIPLTVTPHVFHGEDGAEALADLLTNMERDLPVVVFSSPARHAIPDRHDEAMSRAARMTSGLALVCNVDVGGSAALANAIGESYSVWDGAFRIYLPGLDPALNEEWRHRYTILSHYVKDASAAGKLISRAIVRKAGTRRPPDSYEVAVRLLDSDEAAEPREVVELLDIALEENTQYRDRFAALDDSYLELVEDKESLEAENNTLRDELNVMRRKLALVENDLWATQLDDMQLIVDRRLPADVDLPSDAATMAQQHLSDYLDFPAAACVDMQDIDTCVEARSWGSSSWRAFRALHAYAKEQAGGKNLGSFWTWCQNSKHPFAWTATPKKLAMTESKTVNGNDKLRAKRMFTVDVRVDASGKVYMQAHIKIAEGGGLLAPRIYFIHSQESKTVHIGYFGPHRNVPNTLA